MVHEIILAGRKPGCSQHALSKSMTDKEDSRGPQVTSSVYWRARQHPSQVPESQQTDSRDIPIMLPINNKAFQQFSRLSDSSCSLCQPCRGTEAQHHHLSFYGQAEELGQRGHHLIPMCLGDATPAPGLWAPLIAYLILLCSSAVGGKLCPAALIRIHSDLRWDRRGRAPKCHRGKLPSHFTCGLCTLSLSHLYLQKHHSHPVRML